MSCGQQLGKGWSLGPRLWCLIVKLSLSHWYPGPGAVVVCNDSWFLPSFLTLIFILCPYRKFGLSNLRGSHNKHLWNDAAAITNFAAMSTSSSISLLHADRQKWSRSPLHVSADRPDNLLSAYARLFILSVYFKKRQTSQSSISRMCLQCQNLKIKKGTLEKLLFWKLVISVCLSLLSQLLKCAQESYNLERVNILARLSIYKVYFHKLYEPQHEISNNVVCVASKASDQPAHTRSLIRALASRLHILWVFSY